MRILKRSVTIALLLFVGATVGMLIAQEVSHTDSVPVTESSGVGTVEVAESDAPVEVREQSAPASAEATVDAAEESSAATNPADGDLETSIEGEAEPAEVVASGADPVWVVDAIYFHNTLRCHTCKTIEETAKAVLEREFSEEFAAGQMHWSTINMERQQHYVEEFDLVKPTLILVRTMREEQLDWVALDETWSLIRSEVRFADYVENETRAFLEAGP